MRFRPCIDIHNGKVKQIVGSTLKDEGDMAQENFVSVKDAAYFAGLYKEYDLKGGHVIMLNGRDSQYYEATKAQALLALSAYPGGLQAGGGINAENAAQFIEAGASHVIVTSYVFKDGKINYKNMEKLAAAVGREHVVLDLSCRRRGGSYYIVTDRWQKFTSQEVTQELLVDLSKYADEFLVHAVDVEGKSAGVDRELAQILGSIDTIPVTYAGGVGSLEHLARLKEWGRGRLDVTIGSALDIFGGSLKFEDVIRYIK